MKGKLLFLGCNHNQIPYLKAINKNEWNIVGVDLNKNAPGKDVCDKFYNVGYENQPVIELANLVKKNIEKKVEIILTETNDNRSYHISSDKIKNELGFINKYTIEDAIIGIKNAFKRNEYIDSLKNDIYFNVKMMKKINLE